MPLSWKRGTWFTFPFALAALLTGCGFLGGSKCPIEDESFCEFVRELEPLIAASDTDALLDRTSLLCCKRDYAGPDEAGSPGFDPDQPCVRSGVYRGEGACLTADQFNGLLSRHAPLSVDHLVYTPENFAGLRIDMGELAILISTNDPEWFLVIFSLESQQYWQIVAVHQIRRAVLDPIPTEAFVSWPPELETPKLPPRVTQGVG
jgi:hypothetical protein